jgi:nicotinamide phosphoribosyltransferase
MKKSNKHYGDYSDAELKSMSPEKLIEIILNVQNEDNFIIMTDSYKMTHHLLYPDGLRRVYSYMEPRGGEMPYTVFFGLQYYIKKYIAGRRITAAKIEEAREANIAHFGFDCFDDTMWYHILNKHDGKLPLKIKALPEGTPIAVKNIVMDLENTDNEHCAALTNITETLLMKIWATCTVAAYNRIIKVLIVKYHALTSDLPEFLIDYMHHDFGYRGTSSEETARLMAAAAMTSFKGTDTMGGLSLVKKFYSPDGTTWAECMPGFSVIASEHSVMCSYGGRHKEAAAYLAIINKVKNHPKIKSAKPLSGVIILSLVSDTYNIYNIPKILKELEKEFIGWTNDNGIPLKIVVRPDSGVPANVLFGYNEVVKGICSDDDVLSVAPNALCQRVANDMGITLAEGIVLVEKGLFGILMEQFGTTVNSKGFKVLHPQIGILQGDGVVYYRVNEFFQIMYHESYKIDTMMLVVGSGGKNLQAHDRDEQKWAIKATEVDIEESFVVTTIPIEKNPITDPGKKSKKGDLKLAKIKEGDSRYSHENEWMNFETLQEGQNGFKEAENLLVDVFENGEILVEYGYDEIRTNNAIHQSEFKKLALA